ncbi:MAG: hypothetical protein JSW34_03290 [Candidatus Zixiibacteriota bacterium]|nr:MAG: hypothetical protein JSW34_03290 [candidate division Zixibacteria bacterium]
MRTLPEVTGISREIKDNDQLDVMAQVLYADSTKFWHIADANTELEARNLLSPTGRVILVPET